MTTPRDLEELFKSITQLNEIQKMQQKGEIDDEGGMTTYEVQIESNGETVA
jgi:hypothetical protein